MVAKPVVLVTGDFDIPPTVACVLHAAFDVRHVRKVASRDELARSLVGASYYVLGGPEYADGDLLGHGRDLIGIVVMGTGTPSFVDVEQAASRGLLVANTPALNSDSVAEFALGLLLVANADVFRSWEQVRSGQAWCQDVRHDLASSRIGLVGMGSIGQHLVRKLRALSSRTHIMYWSRTRKPNLEQELGIEYASLVNLFSTVDICSVSIAYSRPDTHHLIGRELLELGRGRLRLLHLSNPRIVDGPALRAAITGNFVASAFMDGYYRESIENRGAADDPEGLLGLEDGRFVSVSHKAALTHQAIGSILHAATDQLLRWHQCKP